MRLAAAAAAALGLARDAVDHGEVRGRRHAEGVRLVRPGQLRRRERLQAQRRQVGGRQQQRARRTALQQPPAPLGTRATGFRGGGTIHCNFLR